MKKLFQKINTRGMRSVLLGLVLAFGLSFASSMLVGAATSIPGEPDVQPFIGESVDLMSRIGSLAIGRAAVPDWIKQNFPVTKCFTRNYSPLKDQTCLDVYGGATFANLLINQTGYFNADTVVGVNAGFGGLGGGGFSLDNSTLVIENNGANSGFLVSGLGYRGANNNGPFAPRNLTTLGEVCATTNGTLVRCGPPPVTYYWQVGNWGACTGVVNPSCNGSYQTTNGGVCEGTWQSTGPGSCSGTPTTGDKIKWDGTPFNWSDGRVYEYNSTGEARANCGEGYDLREVNPNNNDMDWNAHNGGGGTACFAQFEDTWIGGNHYEVSVANESMNGQDWWHRLDVTSGLDDGNGPSGKVYSMALNSPARDYGTCESQGTQSSCSAKPGCSWTPGQQQTNYCSSATNEQTCEALNPACNWNPSTTTVSCTGPTTEQACTSQNPACTFNPGNPGTHTRSVVCKNNSGTTVNDSYCIENVSPKPPVTEPCS